MLCELLRRTIYRIPVAEGEIILSQCFDSSDARIAQLRTHSRSLQAGVFCSAAGCKQNMHLLSYAALSVPRPMLDERENSWP